MKFAFSSLCAPKWGFETLAARAKEYGYDGVEIRGFLNETILTSANVFLSEPRKVRQTFESQGVKIACFSSGISFASNKRRDAQSALDLTKYIDMAAALGSPIVKIGDTQVKPGGLLRPGQTREQAAGAFARWLSPLADYAAEKSISIVVENLLSFRNAKEMWLVMEMLSHPSVAVCWDVFNAAVIGELPAISIPTLNNRIQFVHVKDATLGPLGATFCKLGDGNVRVAELLRRLMGIGYTGWVSFEWEKAWLPNLAGEPEEMLPDAIAKMRQWIAPPEDPGKKKTEKKEAAAAPAAVAPATV